MLIAVSAILLVLGVLAYRRTISDLRLQIADSGKRGRDGVGGLGLLFLRLVVLLLFAAVFIGAVFTHVWTERPRRVALVLDVSESMSAVGAESAAAAIAQTFPLSEEAIRQEWVFGDTARTISDFRLQIADSQISERTRIGTGLATVGKTRPGAVVLLSDGQDNGETDAVAAAREIGVPVYTVGFGGLTRRNGRVEQVILPAVVYSGESVDVQVRVMTTGFAMNDERGTMNDERRARGARVRLGRQQREAPIGPGTSEQDVPFRTVFDKPGRQAIVARLDSLSGESNYADNRRSVTVNVRPGRVRVAYVTNRPGVDTRMMLRALESDDRIEVLPDVAVTGSLGNWGQSRQRTRNEERVTRNAPQADVFVLDDVVETGSPAVWQTIAGQVRAGAGLLVLAGPDFQPGPNVGGLLEGTAGRAQTGTFTPELAAEGRVMPWWGTAGGARDVGRGARGEQIRSHDGRDVIDLARVPPFAGLMPLTGANRQSPIANRQSLWLVAQENEVPLIVAGKAGKGRFVYVAGYPLWRWGFGPEANPDQGTPLSVFTTGVMRYLAERDTSPFRLQTDETDLYRGQPVRLVMKAVAPDGRPWTGLSAMVQVVAVSVDSGTGTNPESRDQNPELGTQAQKPETVAVPMTESGGGVYEATIEALAPGRYRAVATVENGDSPSEETGDSPSERLRRTRRGTVPSFLGKAATEFVVAEQAVELASTGMNEGLLRAISEASGGRFFVSDSLPREGNGIALGSYQRRFTFDPRRAVWAYVLIALLAGAEWLLRRRRGML